MDRGLNLVLQTGPTDTCLNSISVRHPVLLRYSTSVEPLPSEGTVTGYPVVLALCPSPPSGWAWDLPCFPYIESMGSPLRTCAVPGTQQIIAPDS